MGTVSENIKNSMKQRFAVILVIIIVLSGFTSVKVIYELIHYNFNKQDFNDYKVNELEEGKAYTGNVNMVLDIIASSEDEKSSYYLIVVANGDYEGYCILETSDMQEEIETLCEQSWDYLTGESDDTGTPVPVIVDVCEAESDVIKWAEEWFEDDGNSDAISQLCQYKLVQRENSLIKSVIILSVSLILIISSVIIIIIYRKKSFDC
jgi:hypothetical protein